MRFRSLKDVEAFVNSDHPGAAKHRAAVRRRKYRGKAASPSAAVARGAPLLSSSNKAVPALAGGGSPSLSPAGKVKGGNDKKIRGKYKKKAEAESPGGKKFTMGKDGVRAYPSGGKGYVKIKDRFLAGGMLSLEEKGGKEGGSGGSGGDGDSQTGARVKRKYTKKAGPKTVDVTKEENQEQQRGTYTKKLEPKKKAAIGTGIEESPDKRKHNKKLWPTKKKKAGITKEIQDYLAPGSGDDLERKKVQYKKRKQKGEEAGVPQHPKKKSKMAAARAGFGAGVGVGLPRSPAATASSGNASIMSDGGGSGEDHRKKRGRPLGSKNKKSKKKAGGGGDPSARSVPKPKKQSTLSPKDRARIEGLAGRQKNTIKNMNMVEGSARTREARSEMVPSAREGVMGTGTRVEDGGATGKVVSAAEVGGAGRESLPEARKEFTEGVRDAAASTESPRKDVKGVAEEDKAEEKVGGHFEATSEKVPSPEGEKKELSIPDRRHSAGDTSKGKKGDGGDASALSREPVRNRKGGRLSLPVPSTKKVDGGSKSSAGSKGKGKASARGKVKGGSGDAEGAESDDTGGVNAGAKKQKKRASTTPLRQSSRAAAAAATAALTEVFDKRSYPTTSAIPGGAEGGRQGWGAWYS